MKPTKAELIQAIEYDADPSTRYPIRLDAMGRHIEMKPTGEVRWVGATLQQGWAPTRGGLTIWHDVQVVEVQNV